MTGFQIIPPYQFPPDSGIGLVSRETLNGQSGIDEVQLATCALNAPLRYGYGLNRLGAQLLQPIKDTSGNLLLPFIISRGRIESVDSIEFESQAAPPTVGQTIYLGNPVQAVDPWLAAAWAASSPPRVYADTLPNIAWGVLRLPPTPGLLITGLTITAKLLRVYDPRLDSTQPGGSGSQRLADATTWAYSANPVLALADFLRSPDYGRGETLDWASVMACATVDDQVLAGSTNKRRAIGVVIDEARDVFDVEETLRAYAGVWIVREGGTVFMVPDAPASSVFAYTNASGSANYIANSIKIVERKRRDSPTVVSVKWTDTSVKPWKEQTWTEPAGGLAPGVPWREQVVSYPGIQDAGFAKREALRRVNDYIASDLTVQLVGFGEAIQLRIGDVVTLTDSEGFGAKPFRLVGHRPAGLGLWEETLQEYDPQVYSDAIATGPGIIDSILPQPHNPPTVTGVSAVEEVYATVTGQYLSRFVVNWAAPNWPQSFIQSFIIETSQGGKVVDLGFSSAGQVQYVTPPLPENLPYTIGVSILSVVQVRGASSPISITNNGKAAFPSRVVSIDAFEINGEVRATIDPAKDVDMFAHEYRYSNAYGAAFDDASLQSQWTTATVIDRVAYPSRTMVTKAIAAGNWRLLVKGLDSVKSNPLYPYGQESVYPRHKDLTVTSDANAFVASSGNYGSPLLKNVALRGAYWVTDFAQTWNAIFTAAMNTYTNPLWTYHTAGTSVMLSEIADVGATVTGDWSAQGYANDLGGTGVIPQMELCSGGEATKAITGATNATPIVMTVTGHGYITGDEVVQSGVLGNTAANGRFWITVIDANTYSLQTFDGTNVAGNGTWASGGTQIASRWSWSPYLSMRVKTASRYVRVRLTTTGTMMVPSPMASYQVNVIAKPFGGFFTSSASAPVFVRFQTPLTKVVSLTVTASGTGGSAGKYDKVEVSGGRAVQSLSNALRYVAASSQYVTCPSTANNSVTSAFTIECWFKASYDPTNAQCLMRKAITAAGTNNAWGLRVRPGGFVRGAAVIAGTTYTIDTSFIAADDSWHHAALTLSSGTLTLYVDGLVVGTAAVSGTWTAPDSPVGIGANPPENGSGAWAAFLNGCLQEARIWNVARTQAQIQALMSTAAVGNESGLVALYHLNATTGTTATDSQTNVAANNGTLTNGPSWRPLDGFDGYVFDGASQLTKDASFTGTGV